MLEAPTVSPHARRSLFDMVAEAGTDYRSKVYSKGLGAPAELSTAEIGRLIETALALVDHSLRANRRQDGLYHAYNLLEFTEGPAGIKLHHLDPMLEGQVAVLSSGLLTTQERALPSRPEKLPALSRPPVARIPRA
jgi:hypothetical protein